MKKLFALLLALMLVLSLVSCGGSANDAAADKAAPEAMDGGYAYTEDESGYSMELPFADGAASDAGPTAAMQEKMVYIADLSAETMEYDKAVSDVKAAVSKAGGYIESCSEYTGGYYDAGVYVREGNRSVSFALRIPSEKFNDFLAGMETALNVTHRNIYSENVTMQYVDLEARIKNLKAQEQRLQELLKSAENMEQLLSIEDHLTSTRTQIEQAEGEMRVLENRVSYCTVNLSVNETQSYSPSAQSGFGQRLARGFKGSFEKLGRDLENFAVTVSNNFIQLIIAAAVIVVLIRVLKKKGIRLPRRHKKEDTNGEA